MNNFIIDEESSENGGHFDGSQEASRLKLESTEGRGLISYDYISTSQLRGDLHDFQSLDLIRQESGGS